jgi:YggT family protein
MRCWPGAGRAEYEKRVGGCQARLQPRASNCFAGRNVARTGAARRWRMLAIRRTCRYRRTTSLSPEHRMRAILWLINTVITLYIWLLIAQAILSWLLAFGVINRYNRTVSVIGDFLYRITEPALRPIRAMLPNFGGIDISPVVLILILYFLRILINEDLAPVLLSIAP